MENFFSDYISPGLLIFWLSLVLIVAIFAIARMSGSIKIGRIIHIDISRQKDLAEKKPPPKKITQPKKARTRR